MIDALDASNERDGREVEAGCETVEPTRERILDVAEGLFAERGLAGTAVRDIAREAGLTAASLYNHFDGKQALYDAVLARGVQPLFDLIEGLGEAEPDEARTREALTGGDSLSQVAHGWLRPIVAQGLAAMRNRSDSAWSEEEQPLAVAAWIHVILGHFAIAPLLEALFDFDPLAPEQLERQKRFLRHFARLMMSGGEGAGRESGD
jgi:AcrR family transcriptional regulator